MHNIYNIHKMPTPLLSVIYSNIERIHNPLQYLHTPWTGRSSQCLHHTLHRGTPKLKTKHEGIIEVEQTIYHHMRYQYWSSSGNLTTHSSFVLQAWDCVHSPATAPGPHYRSELLHAEGSPTPHIRTQASNGARTTWCGRSAMVDKICLRCSLSSYHSKRGELYNRRR